MNRGCQQCGSDDDVTYSEHYGRYLCMDCYNEASELESLEDYMRDAEYDDDQH